MEQLENKTACTVLQEMMVRLNGSPSYELVAQTGPHHAVVFEYRCEALGVRGTGRAPSKKEAKQAAARAVLGQLAARGQHVPAAYARPGTGDEEAVAVVQPERTAVMLLHDLCETYGLGGAEYELVGDTGPPHQRLFTVRVQVGAHVRTATGYNKRAARAQAAHLLYLYLKENLARLTGDIDESAALARSFERAVERYCEVRDTTPRALLGQRIHDYHLGLLHAHDAESIQRARQALSSALEAALPAEEAVSAVAAALGLAVSRKGPLLSLGPAAPPLLFAAHSLQRAHRLALQYLQLALHWPVPLKDTTITSGPPPDAQPAAESTVTPTSAQN